MLARVCLRTLFLLCLLAGSWAQAVELETDRYDVYVGHLDSNGDPDFYFHGKPLTIILHGDIATPIVLPAPPSFAIFQNRLVTQSTPGGPQQVNTSEGYWGPEPYRLTDSAIASRNLTLYRPGVDFFVGDFNGDGHKDWLLRGASASQAAVIIHGEPNGALPSIAHQYRGVHQLPHNLSDRNINVRIQDSNEDGRDDIVVLASHPQYADVAYESDSQGIPRDYAPANTAPAVTTPKLVGSTAGEFRVDESGASTYSIPLSLPQGSGGVTPELSFNYSSQAGNGLLGQGWSLGGISGISRCRQTLADDGVAKPITWGAEDRFCLDGERLVLETGSNYGAVGATYKTAIDSFVEVKSHGGELGKPAYFTVTRKDGSKSEYGRTVNARASMPGSSPRVMSWMQNRFEDSVDLGTGRGNAINFLYEGDHSSGHRLKEIRYAYGLTSTPAVTVGLTYEDRTDVIRGYQAGLQVITSKRLQKVIVTDTQHNSTANPGVRSYRLRYHKVPDDNLHLKQSKLASVQECVDTQCLPATHFDWAHQAIGFDGALTGTIALPSGSDDRYLKTYMPADITGDGNLDLLYLELSPASDGEMHHRVYQAISDGTRIVSTNLITTFTGSQYAGTAIAVVDYNADGRQDLAFFRPGSSGSAGYWRIYRSRPQVSGSWRIDTTSSIQTPISQSNVNFMDFNSDGLVDAISSSDLWTLQRDPGQAASSSRAYHFVRSQNGYPWVGLDPLSYPREDCDRIGESRVLINSQGGDFNGDGTGDFIGYHYKSSLCNNYGVAGPKVLYALVAEGHSLKKYARLEIPHTNIQVVDINGDGLSDLFYKNDTAYFYALNNGEGFNSPVKFGDEVAGITPSFTDYNGDGASDVYWHDTSKKQLIVRLWTGGEFGSARVIRETSVWRSKDSHIFMDMNGDGQPDYVHVSNSNIRTYRGRTLSAGHAPNSIIGIDNGLGHHTHVTYGTLGRSGHYERIDVGTVTKTGHFSIPYSNDTGSYEYQVADEATFYERLNGGWELPSGSKTVIAGNARKDHPTLELTGSMPVVTSVSSTAPRAGNEPGGVKRSAHSKISYYYGQAKMQASGRGFLGFQKLKTVDEQSGVATITTYRQDYPFIDRPLSTEVYSASHEDAALLSYSGNTWDYKVVTTADGSKRYQPYLKKSVERSYNLFKNGASQGAHMQTTVTDQLYDDYGNPTDITVTTTGIDASKRVVRTENTYGTTTAQRKMGRLTHTKVTSTRNSGEPEIRESSFVYKPGSDPAAGLLEREIIEPNDSSLRQVTEYAYDTFGNKTSVTKSASGLDSRSSTTQYDYLGRYITSRKNALQFTVEEVLERHWTGAPKKIKNINGVLTTISYDALGREVSRSDDTGALSTTQYNFCNFGCPLGAVYSADYVNNKVRSAEYFDALGRVIRKSHISFNGKWIYENTEYDSHGRVKHQSNPYFAGQSPSGWTKYYYDLSGRPTQVIQPDGNPAGTTTYEGFTTTVTNALGQQTKEIRNALGELIRVTDQLGSTISYKYDAAGNLLEAKTETRIPEPRVVTVRMCYDKMGRKIAMHDPDKGGFVGNAASTCADVASNGGLDGWWYYSYNAFGELKHQKDTKKQTRTMTYDLLGRMKTRTDRRSDNSVEGHTRWFYDTNVAGEDQVSRRGTITRVVQSSDATDESCSPANFCTTYDYDHLGRKTSETVFHPGAKQGFTSSVDYDSLGRAYLRHDVLFARVLPESGTQQHYNQYGYKSHVTDLASGDLLHKIHETDARGQITKEERGNGVVTTFEYHPTLGHLEHQQAMIGGLLPVQDIAYQWDQVGNLRYRHNQSVNQPDGKRKNLKESFCYDELNRLIKSRLDTLEGDCSSGETPDVEYDGLGNITRKAGVGVYKYGDQAGPHAVTKAGNASYTYDRNGNMTYDDNGTTESSDDRSFIYSSFDKPIAIAKGNHKTEFSYGPDRSRYKRVDTNSNGVTTTHYLGDVERIHKEGSNTITWRRTVAGAIYTVHTDLDEQVEGRLDKAFIYTDHLGSTDVITDSTGGVKNPGVLQSQSFDAWGKRRNADDWRPLSATELLGFDTSLTKRGYTGHEHMDELGLIHMNGRIYDAKLARFLQADPFIQAASNTQSYNRYSYLWNNPLNATDPSGFFLKKLFRSANKLLGDFAPLAGIALMFIPGVGQWAAAAWYKAAFVGFVAGGISTGSVKGALHGALSAGVFHGIGSHLSNFKGNFAAGLTKTGFAAKVALHSTAGGVMSVLQGGKFGHGFASAGLTAGLSSFNNSQHFGKAGFSAQRVAAAAVIGGTASKITGGKFANGAVTGAFSQAFNQEQQEAKALRAARSNQLRAGSYQEAIDQGIEAGVKIRSSGEGHLVRGRNIGAPVIFNEPWFGDDYYSYPAGLEYDGAGAGFHIALGEGALSGAFGNANISGAAAMIVNVAEGNTFNASAYALGIGGTNWSGRPQYYTDPIYATFSASGETYKYQVNQHGMSSCTVYIGSSSSC